MARVSLELGSRGTASYETLAAIPVDDFIAALCRVRPGRVLVVGGGRARARARARALAAARSARSCSPRPGNAGIARDGVQCFDVAADDVPASSGSASEQKADLVVVGPEAPLVAGLVDDAGGGRHPRVRARRAAAARIEGSKAYAKELMRDVRRADRVARAVPRPRGGARPPRLRVVPGGAEGRRARGGQGRDHRRRTSARRARRSTSFFGEQRFGETEVVLEEFLEGEELSLLALCDGERARAAGAGAGLQAHLRRRRRARTPAAWAATRPCRASTPSARARSPRAVHQPIVDELRARGTPFHGVLYAGLMMTAAGAEGARVQRPLRRPGDAGGAAAAALRPARAARGVGAAGRPRRRRARVVDDWAVTVVLASRGYPESSSSGDVITGLDEVDGGAEVFHAGTAERRRRGRDGRRPGANVTGLGATPGEARDRAYAAAERIEFDGRQMRTRHRRARGGEGGGAERAASRGARPRGDGGGGSSSTSSTWTRRAVGIVMGSKSDMPVMEKAGEELEERGIRYEIRVMSAHRDPDMVADYAKNARMRGLRVIIAGAGLSAALPGVVAAHTDLPVIGVPLTSQDLGRRRARRAARRSRRCRPACRSLRGGRQRAQRRRAGGAHPRRLP